MISLEQQAVSPQYVKSATANTISVSNMVTTNQSVAVTFAQSLFIQSIEKHTTDTVSLFYISMPKYYRLWLPQTRELEDYQRADLASVSENGLTYIGKETMVRSVATTIDGLIFLLARIYLLQDLQIPV